jgi:uncharacterized BrkB/YihY/UPF0761 family membrane protein
MRPAIRRHRSTAGSLGPVDRPSSSSNAPRRSSSARERHASVRLVVQAFESDRRRAGGLLAGGLAYKVFLWLIPLVLFLVSAFGLVVDLAGDDPADLARQTGMTAALASAISQPSRRRRANAGGCWSSALSSPCGRDAGSTAAYGS